MPKKIIFNSNSDYNLYLFRGGIMKRMKDNGWEVHAVCPLGNYGEELKSDGFFLHPIYLSRHGKNPFKDFVYLVKLFTIFYSIKPSIIHSFTIKPNIYGNIAAVFARIPKRINTVSGLGYVYIGSNFKKKILRAIVNLLYTIAFLFSHRVIFQNDEDCKFFIEDYGIVSKKKATVIRSSGVDCNFFSMETVNHEKVNVFRDQFGIQESSLVVLMAARMIWEKGVKEFVEAAKLVKKEYPEIIFLLVGPLENGSPSAVTEEYLLSNKEYVQWVGHQKDMKHILALASIAVLPSYREGIPRFLLEAMAMGKPIITTDTPGCREVLEQGKNGFLVMAKDIEKLYKAIRDIFTNKSTIAEFGTYGKEKVKFEFSDQFVIETYAKEYNLQ